MTQPASELILDRVFAHEKAHANDIFLTQPIGEGKVINYTWAQTMDQSRRMAARGKSKDFKCAAMRRDWSMVCAHV